MPAPRRLIIPARVMRRWLVTSASAGASFSVETKNWVAFMKSLEVSLNFHEPGMRNHANSRPFRPGAIMVTVQESGSDYARPRGLQAQRRHCAAQRPQPGVLGQAPSYAFLAIPAGRHQV